MMECPACGREMSSSRVNIDAAYCPEHGWLSGLQILELRGLPRWEAGVEIRAAQALREIAEAAMEWRNERRW